jgi:cell division protein FtsL
MFVVKMWMVVLLAVLVVVSAISVVYAKHLNRGSFIELQKLQTARDNMNVEWGQLQLEQSTFATHSRIEEIARDKLGMIMPSADEIEIVKP